MLEKSENFSSQSSENGFGIVRHSRIEFHLGTFEIFPFFQNGGLNLKWRIF